MISRLWTSYLHSSMPPLMQNLPDLPGAPWWLILVLFAVFPAIWQVTKYVIERIDTRQKERQAAESRRRQDYKDVFRQKDEQIKELYDRFITEGIENREALSTAARTLEGFVEKENALEAKLDHIIDLLQPVAEYAKKRNGAT